MFTNYFIKNDIIYIEIDVNYEFASYNKTNKSIIDEIKNFFKLNKINMSFKKIIITCSGVIIGSIILLNNDKNIEKDNIKYVPSLKNNITYVYKEDTNNEVISNNNDNIKNNEQNTLNSNDNIYINDKNNQKNDNKNDQIIKNNTNSSSNLAHNTNISNKTEPGVSNQIIISVKRSNGSYINLPIEEYVVGVIAAEMPASFNIEALKAQSVLARTYALKAKSIGKVLTDTVSTQAYIDENEMKTKWGSDFSIYYNKIKNATLSTKDEYLSYNGEYIEALYHSTNNGKTESSLDVFGNYYPYLISVSSEFDKSASSYLRTTSIDLNTMSSKLGIPINNDSLIEVISYTDGDNIKEININNKTFTGKQIRELLNLRSADFDISINDNNALITTRGFGHGVGMSQYGANGMANAGYSYIDILSHYYPNTLIKK